MSAVVAVDAKPEPISIDVARTAVVVVDMQNDFGAEGGMFARAGIDIPADSERDRTNDSGLNGCA